MNKSDVLSRRSLLKGAATTSTFALLPLRSAFAQGFKPLNIAAVATFQSSYMSADSRPHLLASQTLPNNSQDQSKGMWSSWPMKVVQTIEYTWPVPVPINKIDLYWSMNPWGFELPASVKVFFWDGQAYQPVEAEEKVTPVLNQLSSFRFTSVRTQKLRLEIQPAPNKSVALLRWLAWTSAEIPTLPPKVFGGIDRSVVLGGSTYLSGYAGWTDSSKKGALSWSPSVGTNSTEIADHRQLVTSARFSAKGNYALSLAAADGGHVRQSSIAVRVVEPPPKQRLDVVYTRPYAVTNSLWKQRTKALIVNWIPHCVAYCERIDLPTGQGGIDNFVEAAKALRGEPHAKHKGYVFSNAWVHQTVESICLALMVDAEGDTEILAAQRHLRDTLERWIPIILAAQEQDGYLQTAYTLSSRAEWPERWSPEHRADHEGYVAGYFIESAINHYTYTDGKDLRLYNAAKKLADCWVANLGPGKRKWFDGHQEMEQALVRFGRFVNDMEGKHKGDPYIRLARFLLDSREGGATYDQSHLPAIQQYEALGHAVRAVYFYSGMADIAAETGDIDYQSAVLSLWDNMVNRKYYVTGGVGSGDTSEGFGRDYGLRHDAYCEACSSCGLIFFQYKMNLAYHHAKFADLYEETLYNALLGSMDLPGKSFCYTNPLINTERAKWHSCPCCVGNIPRTLLMLPTWQYVKSGKGLYVNLFIGGRVTVRSVAGVDVKLTQETEYPWDGKVSITLSPTKAKQFAMHIRVPDRKTSELYESSPAVAGIRDLCVNGKPVAVNIHNGYATIERIWKTNDRVTFELPMKVQRVRASEKIAATKGQQALRYGPLIYSFETADQPSIEKAIGQEKLTPTWAPDLLGGVMAITGKWGDGSPLKAIPYYARENRNGGPIREFPAEEQEVEFAPGATVTDEKKEPRDDVIRQRPSMRSRVWVFS